MTTQDSNRPCKAQTDQHGLLEDLDVDTFEKVKDFGTNVKGCLEATVSSPRPTFGGFYPLTADVDGASLFKGLSHDYFNVFGVFCIILLM
jgi:hypothetical protein